MTHAKAHDGKVLEVYLTRKRREVLDDYQAGLEDPYDLPSDTEEPAPIRHEDSAVLTVHVPTTLATVGRTPPSIVAIPDSAHPVSGKHLDVETRDGALWVRDVSRNGSYFAATKERLPKDQWTAVPTGTVLILADNQNGVHVKLVPQAQATGTHDHPF